MSTKNFATRRLEYDDQPQQNEQQIPLDDDGEQQQQQKAPSAMPELSHG